MSKRKEWSVLKKLTAGIALAAALAAGAYMTASRKEKPSVQREVSENLIKSIAREYWKMELSIKSLIEMSHPGGYDSKKGTSLYASVQVDIRQARKHVGQLKKSSDPKLKAAANKLEKNLIAIERKRKKAMSAAGDQDSVILLVNEVYLGIDILMETETKF